MALLLVCTREPLTLLLVGTLPRPSSALVSKLLVVCVSPQTSFSGSPHTTCCVHKFPNYLLCA